MRAAMTGMNDSATHYPFGIWGKSRKNLQIILGFNSSQKVRNHENIITQKMRFSFKDFFRKSDQIGSFLWIGSHN